MTRQWSCSGKLVAARSTSLPRAVVAEVAFLLTSRNVYNDDVKETVKRLEIVLNIQNLHLDRKADILRALRLWAERPSMGFVDALVVAMAESLDASLASFDTGLRRYTQIERHPWRSEP